MFVSRIGCVKTYAWLLVAARALGTLARSRFEDIMAMAAPLTRATVES